jgi:hypothetical protein
MKAHFFNNWHWNLNGVELTHFAEGDDAVTIKYRADRGMDKVGADGRMALAISADKTVEVTIKLQQVSPSNKYLNGLHDLQKAGAQSFVPLNLFAQDTYRQDRGVCTNGYISKYPDIVRGAGINVQEWTFVFERGDLRLEDSAFVGFQTAAAEAQ